MSIKESSSALFQQLRVDVENNIESIEKCSELFETFLCQVGANPSNSLEHLELAVLWLCVGRYQESYNIIRRMERSVAAAPDHPSTTGKKEDSRQEFFSGKSAPPPSANSDDEDILEDVEWLLPQPNVPATSPYQWLYIGKM